VIVESEVLMIPTHDDLSLRWRRISDTWTGAVLPAICFALAWDFGPEWQTGRLDDYAQIYLSGRVTLVFLPLLLFAVAGLLAATWWPASRRWPMVRIAVAGGVAASIQYLAVSALVLLAAEDRWLKAVVIAAVACPLLQAAPRQLRRGIRWLVRRLGAARLLVYLILLQGILGAYLVAHPIGNEPMATQFFTPVLTVVGFSLFASLVAAPCWSLGVYFRLGRELFRSSAAPPPTRPFTVALGGAWTIAWALAFREGMRQLLLRYSELPTEPPDCFLATAAARGHASIVGSEPARTADGRGFRATRQLRRCKAAERLLAALAPRAHRLVREVYDVAGRRLARRLTHPLLADLAWLALKPVELAAAMVTWLAVRDSGPTIDRIWPAARS
jgi:Family of unknown function (DUF6688)